LLSKRGGFWFSVNGFFLQQLYYLYSIAGVVAGVAIYFARSWQLKRIAMNQCDRSNDT
jgi:phage shock protein PspC (stress-responsive transcriptional regulator)